MKKLIFLPLVLFAAVCVAQVDSGVKVTEGQQDGQLLDSIRQTPYPYTLPLLGKKAAAKGFLLPYPIGVMINAYRGSQDVTISDLSVGIHRGDGSAAIQPISLDEVVDFGDVRATVNNLNMRTDVWILPFLDVYGIFGKAWVQTDVEIAAILDQPVDFSTTAKFDGFVYGGGAMLTGGIRSIFVSADFNMVWTHFDQMANDNRASNFSLRTGYVFHIKPETNLAVWGGAGRVFLNSLTKGSIPLSEVAPDMGANYTSSTWYQNMTPAQQELTDRVVANFVDKNKGDIIDYSLSKRPKNNWTMIIGAQYQPNRRWQLRTEVNLLGGRRSGLLSANYRFGIK